MLYDQLGEQGLKDKPPPGNESSSGFNRSAEDIFTEFFGSSPLNFGSSGAGRSKRFSSDGGGSGPFAGFSGDFNFRTRSERTTYMPKKPSPVETKLLCSMEELYSGSTRKMKISRTVMDPNAYGYVSLVCVWRSCAARLHWCSRRVGSQSKLSYFYRYVFLWDCLGELVKTVSDAWIISYFKLFLTSSSIKSMKTYCRCLFHRSIVVKVIFVYLWCQKLQKGNKRNRGIKHWSKARMEERDKDYIPR